MVGSVRAGRLVTMLLLLQSRGQMTARELSAELEVSVRTVLRDIEALSGSGVPVYAVRGAQGGFRLLGNFRRDLPVPASTASRTRVHLRLSPTGRQLAAVLGRPVGLRVRRTADDGWAEATAIVDSPASAVADVLALGPEAEVVRPVAIRAAVAEAARAVVDLYGSERGSQ
jgi:predicted DNA-binding transcriptional regulator YafY